MELLKTPPPVSKSSTRSNSNTSFTLNSNLNSNSKFNSSFISADSSDDPSEIAEINNIMMRIADNDRDREQYEYESSSYMESSCDEERENDESFTSYYSSFSNSQRNIRDNSKNHSSTIHHSTPSSQIPSSPSISSEELRERLAATKAAFQKSLQSQKEQFIPSASLVKSSSRLCGVPVAFEDIDSFGFESDLSTDSFIDTKKELEAINAEARKLILATIIPENIPVIHNQNRSSHSAYFLIITSSILTLALSVLFIYFSFLKSNSQSHYFELEPFLQKCEQVLNFWLQEQQQEEFQILIQ